MNKQLLNFLYSSPFYEVGYVKDGYMKRHMTIESEYIPDFIEKFGHLDCYISSYGWENESDADNLKWNNVIFDKIWIDFDTDNPKELPDVATEVTKFCEKLNQDFKVKPYAQFSGSKGYHVYLKFLEPINTTKKALSQSIKYFREKYDLKYVCESCITGPVRLQRLPYTINTKSGKECIPIPWNIASSPSLNQLISICEDMVELKERQKEVEREERKQRWQEIRDKGDKDLIDFESFDIRDVFNELFSSYVEYTDVDNNLRADCPWHSSSGKNGPPLIISEHVLTCFSCGSIGVWEVVLRKFEGNKSKALKYFKGEDTDE